MGEPLAETFSCDAGDKALKLDLEMERAKGVCRLGVALLVASASSSLDGDRFLRGVFAGEKKADCSDGDAVAELVSNILIKSFAFVGEAGRVILLGVAGRELDEPKPLRMELGLSLSEFFPVVAFSRSLMIAASELPVERVEEFLVTLVTGCSASTSF